MLSKDDHLLKSFMIIQDILFEKLICLLDYHKVLEYHLLVNWH